MALTDKDGISANAGNVGDAGNHPTVTGTALGDGKTQAVGMLDKRHFTNAIVTAGLNAIVTVGLDLFRRTTAGQGHSRENDEDVFHIQ